MLETLNRLKGQIEVAILCVEADQQMKEDPRIRLGPGVFRVGDFGIADRTKLTNEK